MKRRIFAALLVISFPVQAKDYGTMGTTWAITENDLLTVIEHRLEELEQTGRIDELNQQMVERGRAYVSTPPPVPGIIETTEERSWLFDPSFVVQRDIKDHRGRVIAAAGTRINPLDYQPIHQSLLFIQGDHPAQVAWALDKQAEKENAKIILVAGQPLEMMKKHSLRIYFDQKGLLTQRLGITSVPASVVQEGNRLRISEVRL